MSSCRIKFFTENLWFSTQCRDWGFDRIIRLLQKVLYLSLTCGWVDARSDVEVAKSVGMGHVAAALLVVVVAALMVRQAASQRQLRCIPIKGAVQGFLKIQHYNYWTYR